MNKVLPLISVAPLALAAACSEPVPTIESISVATPTTAVPVPVTPQPPDCPVTTFTQAPAVDALPGGIWKGTLIDCSTDIQHDNVAAMVSEDGRFRIITEDDHVLAGALATSGDSFNGSGLDFAPPGTEYFSGPSTEMFVTGRIAERQTFAGRWGTEWGGYGVFHFDYDREAHERATSLADLEGVWPSYATHLGSPVAGVWTVEADGRFSGQDELGCLQTGQFSLIEERYNIVSVELAVSGCALAGTYSGLARRDILVDWWEKGITVSVDDGSRALRILLAVEGP